MLCTEVEYRSLLVQHFNEVRSDNSKVNDLTRLVELHEAALIQLTKHLQAMRQYHA
jgi:hypothetical protein